MFPGGKVDIEELKSARSLYGHNKILMKCLENAVASLDDNESFVSYLVELGRRHQVRPLKAQYLEVSKIMDTTRRDGMGVPLCMPYWYVATPEGYGFFHL